MTDEHYLIAGFQRATLIFEHNQAGDTRRLIDIYDTRPLPKL